MGTGWRSGKLHEPTETTLVLEESEESTVNEASSATEEEFTSDNDSD